MAGSLVITRQRTLLAYAKEAASSLKMVSAASLVFAELELQKELTSERSKMLLINTVSYELLPITINRPAPDST